MPHYHVRLSSKGDRRRLRVSFDLTREELERRFLTPYRSGKGMVSRGMVFDPYDIDVILIGCSEENSAGLRAEYEKDIARMRRDPFTQVAEAEGVYRDWEIASKAADVTDQFISEPPGVEAVALAPGSGISQPPTDAREVFVVHGRNTKAQRELYALLRAIDLRPLEWEVAVQATGKPTPYVGEILDAAFAKAHAVVVLLTPDDDARLRDGLASPSDPPYEAVLSGQARPNVLFEAGMAMARDQNRTVLVEIGELRPFSDVGGRHVVRLDGTYRSRQALAQRLRMAGCPVNLDGGDWHEAGDFDAVLREMPEGTGDEGSAQGSHRTDDSRDMLVAAVEHGGLLMKLENMGGLEISVQGGANFVEEGSARSEARWRRALDELVEEGLVEDRTGSDQMFWVTASGFDEADSLMGSSGAASSS